MNTWTRDELDRFGAAEEIEITPVGGDDALRRAITIWMVRLGDNLYDPHTVAARRGFALPRPTTKVEAPPGASKRRDFCGRRPEAQRGARYSLPRQISPQRTVIRQHDGQPQGAMGNYRELAPRPACLNRRSEPWRSANSGRV